MCSMSGFVSTRWPFSRIALRASLGRVAVVGEHAEAIVQPLIEVVEFGELILRQRLGGKKIERARVGIFQNGVQDRQVVAQRLAGRGRRDDHDVLARVHRFRGGGLVCVRSANALRRVRGDQIGVHPGRERRPTAPPARGSGASP